MIVSILASMLLVFLRRKQIRHGTTLLAFGLMALAVALWLR